MLVINKYCRNMDRRASLSRCVPELFDARVIKSVLYVGANQRRQCFLRDFAWGGADVTVLELFCENVRALREMGYGVMPGDVRACLVMFGEDAFDATFWWHGPEHIPKPQLAATLEGIEGVTRKLVVLGCPWGEMPQDAAYGNMYEKHAASFMHGEFNAFGYNTESIGYPKSAPELSNITAWKWLQNPLTA